MASADTLAELRETAFSFELKELSFLERETLPEALRVLWAEGLGFFLQIHTCISKDMHTLQLPTTYFSKKSFYHHFSEEKKYPLVVWLCSEVLRSHRKELWEIPQHRNINRRLLETRQLEESYFLP